MVHTSVCGAVVFRVQALPSWPAITQRMPAPPGSGSLIETPVALPVAAASFDTVMLKPIGLPALTVALSALLLMCSCGVVMVADSFCALQLSVAPLLYVSPA